MNEKTIIIGGGLGGLFTGALLAKEGYEVTVLEKNHVIGGGLQTFVRGGMTFETGMHILGGLRPGGSIYKLCNYLGVLDKIELRNLDADCMDAITYMSDGHTYRIPEGREAFTAYLASEFPDSEQDIRNYVDAIYGLSEEVDLFYMRKGHDSLFAHSEKFVWPADEFIAHYIPGNARLQDLLAYMNPMYGGVAGHTPAYIHALINVLYIEGPSRFVGGSLQLAEALAGVITDHGGRILAGQTVTKVNVDATRNVTSVETQSGQSYSASHYVSAIHPARLVQMTDAGAFPKAYRTRVASIPNTYSAFTVFIKFRPQAFPYINHTCYYQDDYGIIWHHWEYDETTWPRGFMYMTPADKDQGSYATKMIVNCLMPFSAVKQWENTTVGRRGADYEQWKARQVEKVLTRLEQLHPGFRSAVDSLWSASPLTIRDYYNQPEGALYGVFNDCKNLPLSQVPIWTKVGNLLLTGQNINLHGICGTPLTAINTAEALVGANKIVEKINRHNNTAYGED